MKPQKPDPKNKSLYLKVKNEAKQKFKSYPSLHASSWIIRQYKKRGGKFTKPRSAKQKLQGTSRWYAEKWTDVRVYLETGKYLPCGSSLRKYKACRPLKRISHSTPLTIRELLKIHSRRKLLKLARMKERDMKGRLYWKSGIFKPSRLRGGKSSSYVAELCRATNPNKKLQVVVFKNGRKLKTVQFGASGYSDYTKHKDSKRRDRYDARHKKRENWTISGITTAGFWSKWLLWNKPSLSESVRHIRRSFGIRIVRKSRCSN